MASSARIEELTKKFEENPRRYFAPLANEYRKAGDLAQAIALCEAHLPQQPGHMSGHVVYGQALFESGKLDESRTVFETALQLDPENLIALRYLGDIALQQGDRHAARQWYLRVLETDPRNEEIQGLLHDVDAMRTPTYTPATAPDAMASASVEEGLAEADIELAELPAAVSDLPGELPPAVIDAEGEILDSEPLLEDFMTSDDAVAPLEGLTESEFRGGSEVEVAPLAEFEATSLSDMIGAAPAEPHRQPADFESGYGDALATHDDDARDLVGRAPESSPLVEEPVGEEPLDLDEHFDLPGTPAAETAADLEVEAASVSADAGVPESEAEEAPAFPSSLSFAEEPGDSAPLQVGPSEEEQPVGYGSELVEGLPQLAGAPVEAGAVPEEIPPAVLDGMEELAEAAAAEVGTPEPELGGAAFVTETMAELYLRQGHRSAAIEVYRQLVTQSPADARLQDRLEELERTGEPSIRSFLAGIASRRPRTAAYDSADAVAAPSGEWMAIPSESEAAAAVEEAPVQVMGWQESTDVVAEIPLAAAAEAGAVPAEIPPAVLDGMEEISEAEAPAPATEPGSVTPAEPPRRASSTFTVDESAVPFDLPGAATPPAAATVAPTPVNTPARAMPAPGSLDALFGNSSASEADTQVASTLAEAFAPVDASTPLAGKPAVPAREELSLDQVFRGDEEAEADRAGGFSFDQFFGSRTPHMGSAAVTPPTGATPPGGTSDRPETPGSTPAATDADDIEQFNSWLQGLKKR